MMQLTCYVQIRSARQMTPILCSNVIIALRVMLFLSLSLCLWHDVIDVDIFLLICISDNYHNFFDVTKHIEIHNIRSQLVWMWLPWHSVFFQAPCVLVRNLITTLVWHCRDTAVMDSILQGCVGTSSWHSFKNSFSIKTLRWHISPTHIDGSIIMRNKM